MSGARFVTAPDGVRAAVYEWGDASGPEVLLIHGFCQSALAWERLAREPAAAPLRLVAYDFRGHGASDKPLAPEHYRDGARWADELHAVIEGTGLARPTIVAWSYAGGVVGEYLNRYGAGRVAAIDFVGASTKGVPEWFGPSRQFVPGMLSDDVAQCIAATRAFVRACFGGAPDAATLETMLAYNMLVPPAVRRAMTGRPFEMAAALGALDVPVLVSHGLADTVVLPEMARYTASVVRDARTSWYEGVGHMPFMEAPARFAAELAQLVERART
jgi:non-heme chloroperoxidase